MKRFAFLPLLVVLLADCYAGPGLTIRPFNGRQGFATRPFTWRQGEMIFEWRERPDSARVLRLPGRSIIWQGSLLPSFWLRAGGKKLFIKAEVDARWDATGQEAPAAGGGAGAAGGGAGAGGDNPTTLVLPLRIGTLGKGRLTISREAWGIRFSSLEIDWKGIPPAIIEMYFGASDEAVKASGVRPTWDRPFMPDWQSFGYCVPGAKGGPVQSYFRMWDFGLANISLGSFGPSMGSPYGAAYPKPLYFAGMGSGDGFVAMGAGTIPDAAMSLRIEATRGCFQYVYNEDSWGAAAGRKRTWAEPLRICLGTTALAAFKNYYRSFPIKAARPGHLPAPFFNTWGLWREKKYAITPAASFAKQLGASVLVLDDGWESFQGSGEPDNKRFPQFASDLGALHDSGMTHGFWETLGWVGDTAAAGLGSADLILDRKGHPCKANWNFDPSSPSCYCLDISSPGARHFLQERTLHEMRIFKPSLLKLDFGYGLPSPAMGVPRNPRYRGERQFAEMLRLIAEAARSVDPSVTILYYGIGPLSLGETDMVSLDDQGDLWYDVAGGHGEWSIWASLLSDRNVAVSGSSGYSWESDDDVILNTAIIGIPGATLPLLAQEKYINRRVAINKWFRKTLLWQPLWLNSRTGDFSGPPRLNCWGRMEKKGADSILTALVLREGDKEKITDGRLLQMNWKGRWALIAQDDADVFSSGRLALIPFDEGEISIPCPVRPAAINRVSQTGERAYTQWDWQLGRLTIRISAEQLQETAGFLLSR
jgi:hypothetical protein